MLTLSAVCVVSLKVSLTSVCVCLFGCVWAQYCNKAFHHCPRPQYCGSQSHNMTAQQQERYIFETIFKKRTRHIDNSFVVVVVFDRIGKITFRCRFVGCDPSFCEFQRSSFGRFHGVLPFERGRFIVAVLMQLLIRRSKSQNVPSVLLGGSQTPKTNTHRPATNKDMHYCLTIENYEANVQHG